MDALRGLVDEIKRTGLAHQHFQGFLHIMVGRRITRRADGVVISQGLTWRELAALLKKVRWDPDAVKELGLEPKSLPPRDRERYWYVAITKARLDEAEAAEAGDRFAEVLRGQGYEVSASRGEGKS